MSFVDTFFGDLNKINDEFESMFTYKPKTFLSNCCGATPLGEVTDDNVGRCNDCKEPAEFTESEEL